ncbi:hypothetical protein BGZ99_004284 [Dissophora globulifera]|uniref:Membrane-associated protein n=1 Tax=Dissophora globulifera TaxID=979702 RepID=A0A9P6RKY4_9FUNG|nr:hypothetical protein BGZ99_004284 [Dissophora globulifera]
MAKSSFLPRPTTSISVALFFLLLSRFHSATADTNVTTSASKASAATFELHTSLVSCSSSNNTTAGSGNTTAVAVCSPGESKLLSNVQVVTGTPAPGSAGLTGRLYDVGKMCNETVTDKVDRAWIAFLDCDGCPLVTKLANLQASNPQAVLIYNQTACIFPSLLPQPPSTSAAPSSVTTTATVTAPLPATTTTQAAPSDGTAPAPAASPAPAAPSDGTAPAPAAPSDGAAPAPSPPAQQNPTPPGDNSDGNKSGSDQGGSDDNDDTESQSMKHSRDDSDDNDDTESQSVKHNRASVVRRDVLRKTTHGFDPKATLAGADPTDATIQSATTIAMMLDQSAIDSLFQLLQGPASLAPWPAALNSLHTAHPQPPASNTSNMALIHTADDSTSGNGTAVVTDLIVTISPTLTVLPVPAAPPSTSRVVFGAVVGVLSLVICAAILFFVIRLLLRRHRLRRSQLEADAVMAEKNSIAETPGDSSSGSDRGGKSNSDQEDSNGINGINGDNIVPYYSNSGYNENMRAADVIIDEKHGMNDYGHQPTLITIPDEALTEGSKEVLIESSKDNDHWLQDTNSAPTLNDQEPQDNHHVLMESNGSSSSGSSSSSSNERSIAINSNEELIDHQVLLKRLRESAAAYESESAAAGDSFTSISSEAVTVPMPTFDASRSDSETMPAFDVSRSNSETMASSVRAASPLSKVSVDTSCQQRSTAAQVEDDSSLSAASCRRGGNLFDTESPSGPRIDTTSSSSSRDGGLATALYRQRMSMEFPTSARSTSSSSLAFDSDLNAAGVTTTIPSSSWLPDECSATTMTASPRNSIDSYRRDSYRGRIETGDIVVTPRASFSDDLAHARRSLDTLRPTLRPIQHTTSTEPATAGLERTAGSTANWSKYSKKRSSSSSQQN